MVTTNKGRVLTESDIQTLLWKKLEQHLTERLQALRARNDGNLTLEDTAKLRGRIAEVKATLDLAKPSPVQQVDAD